MLSTTIRYYDHVGYPPPLKAGECPDENTNGLSVLGLVMLGFEPLYYF